MSSIIKTGCIHLETDASSSDPIFDIAGGDDLDTVILPTFSAAAPSIKDRISEAEAQAQEIVDQAHLEAIRIRELAEEKGYADGRETGMAEAAAEAKEVIDLLRQMAEELSGIRNLITANSEEQVVGLALAVAEKVVRGQVLVDKEIVTRAVEAATKDLLSQDIARIAVSPSDLDLVSQYWAGEHDPSFREHGLEIIADKRIQPGGCVVTTKRGSIDAQLDVQLGEIERAFGSIVDSNEAYGKASRS